MKILRYEELKVASNELFFTKPKSLTPQVLNLNGWAGEIIAVLGNSTPCNALFKQIATEAYPEYSGENTASILFSNFTSNPNLSIRQIIQETICYAKPGQAEEELKFLEDKYLTTGALQLYKGETYHQASGCVKKQVELAVRFILASNVVLLPALLDSTEETMQTLLYQVMLNLKNAESRTKTVFFRAKSVAEAIHSADRVLVLTPDNAGNIAEEFQVPYPHPRNKQITGALGSFKILHKKLEHLLTFVYATEDLISFFPQISRL